MNDVPLLELRDISKSFGPVQALDRVHLSVPTGLVTALVGDNGAGKSVLIKCISGIFAPDHGAELWQGEPVHIRTPHDAAALGLADQGIAVIVISHNLNDVFAVADRLAVLYLGRMVAEGPAEDFDRQRVVELMTSGKFSPRRIPTQAERPLANQS